MAQHPHANSHTHGHTRTHRHRQECPEITYMAMVFRPHSFPVGGMYMKGTGWLTKITRFSFPLLLKRKKYFTNPSCVPHNERKTSPRSTALVNRIDLQPFLRTRWYPAQVPYSATAVIWHCSNSKEEDKPSNTQFQIHEQGREPN